MAKELVGGSVEGIELGGGVGCHRGRWLVEKQKVSVDLGTTRNNDNRAEVVTWTYDIASRWD